MNGFQSTEGSIADIFNELRLLKVLVIVLTTNDAPLECIAKWCLISQNVTTMLSKAAKQDDRSLV